MARGPSNHAEWGRARSTRCRRRAESRFDDWEIHDFLEGASAGINGPSGRIPVRFGANRLADYWEGQPTSDDDDRVVVLSASGEELMLFPLEPAEEAKPAAPPVELPPLQPGVAVAAVSPLAAAMRVAESAKVTDGSFTLSGVAKGLAIGLGAAAVVLIALRVIG